MKFGRRVGQQILAVANGSRLDAVGREDPGYRARLFRVDDTKIILSVVFAFDAAMYARAEEALGSVKPSPFSKNFISGLLLPRILGRRS